MSDIRSRHILAVNLQEEFHRTIGVLNGVNPHDTLNDLGIFIAYAVFIIISAGKTEESTIMKCAETTHKALSEIVKDMLVKTCERYGDSVKDKMEEIRIAEGGHE